MYNFSAIGQKLISLNTVYAASGSQDYLTASFVFDSDWDGLVKTAVFYQVKTTTYPVLLDTEDSCKIPAEAMTTTSYLNIGVCGIKGAKVITTNFVYVKLEDGAYGTGITPDPPSPDVYAQMLAIMAAQGDAIASAAAALTSEQNAAKSAEDALNNKLNGISTHDESASAHSDIRQLVQTAESIARGRATAYVFDTLAQLNSWLAGTYIRPDGKTVADLVTGDNLYIRDTNVKDYWWDGAAAQELEAESPDLADYYTKTQVDAMLPIPIVRSAYDALVAAGTIETDRDYFIREDE